MCQTARMSGGDDIAMRHRLATYWWLASELVRRHPDLNVVETYPMDGFYDCIAVMGRASNRDVHVEMNRLGKIHVHPDKVGFMSTEGLMSHDDALQGVRELEAACGLPKSKSASSSSRLITLRLIARTLSLVVNDSSVWDVRMLTWDGHGHSVSLVEPETFAPKKTPFSSVFPSEPMFQSFVISSKPDEDSYGRFWGLSRNGETIAIFDTRGLIYTREQRVSLKPLYARLGRSLTLTTVHALGNVLP